VNFEDLSDESKLLFAIFATERTAGYSRMVSAFYAAGAPPGSYSEAADDVRAFVFDSQREAAEERRWRKDHQRKVEAKMRT
jgi:hypothetical protein